MRDFHCKDAGMACDFVARGHSDQEILDQASRHAHDVHHLTMDDELERRVRQLIHDEDSDFHRQSSMGVIIP